MSKHSNEYKILQLLKNKYSEGVDCILGLKSFENNNNNIVYEEYEQSLKTAKLSQKNKFRKLFRNMAECVEYLHLNNIIHRTLSLDSFVIDKKGNILLRGLKYACALDDEFIFDDERYKNFGSESIYRYTKKSDIYDLGLCFIEILTGRNIWSEAEEKIVLPKENYKGHNYGYYFRDKLDKIYEEVSKLLPKCTKIIIDHMYHGDSDYTYSPSASEIIGIFEDDYVKYFHNKEEQENELKMLKFLQSKYVVKFHKVHPTRGIYLERYDTDGQYFFEDFSTQQYTKIFQRMSICLEYVHSKGIIHRDIKPWNFLVNKDPLIIVLCDFETSTSRTGKFDSCLTTYSYSAPEVKFGYYYYESDVFSLGLTFISILLKHHILEKYIIFNHGTERKYFDSFYHDLDKHLKKADEKYPNISLLLSQMLQRKHSNRCSISDVVYFFNNQI